MEYEKQIEIKLFGNKCIINIPQDTISSKSLNKILAPNNNSLTNMDDISFSVSQTSEENMNSKNNFYNKKNQTNNLINENRENIDKNYLHSNEKSKLEITYQSIFYSDLKSETSNMKTPLLLLNSKNNVESQQKKDSVVKRLNFDLSNSNSSKNKTNNSNYNNSTSSNNKISKISSVQKEILKNINKINTEIQNINIRKLPALNRNNVVKKISKNLNKEYFIHEKIYFSNNNDKEKKNLEHEKIDKKFKENIVKIENKSKNKADMANKSYMKNNWNNNNIINNEIPNINNHQITENCLCKVKSNNNFLFKSKNKNLHENNNNKLENNLLLYKCSSKPNITNMKIKLNNMMKLNPKLEKEKENINLNILNKDNSPNNKETEIEIIKIIKPNEKGNQKLYPRLTSANSFNTANKNSNLKSYNSYNHSAKIGKLQKNNSNLKTPSLVNKQIILSTPETNSYTFSTSYSAKNNKSPNRYKKNFENKSTDLKLDNRKLLENLNKDPILYKAEAHNSLLKNFFMNPNNFKKKEQIDEYVITNNMSKIHNTNEKIFGKNYLDESINGNKMSLKKFNTDLKIPLKKTNQLGLLTERNINKNNYYNNYGYKAKYNNPNDLQKLFKKNEFDIELFNSIKK